MKRTKSRIAIVLALAIALVTLMPAIALAAGNDITEIAVRGVASPISVDVPVASTTVVQARARTVEVGLSVDDLEDASKPAVVVTESAASDAIIKLFADGDDSSITKPEDIAGASDAVNVALTPGAVIWVKDGMQLVRILINQKADGTIEGEGSVKNAIINVVVPTDIDFALNPLQIGKVTGDSQVTTADYKVINKSNAPVLVDFNITATLASGVSFVDDKSTLEPNKLQGADKAAYFAVLGAEKVATGGPTYADPTTATEFKYTPALAGTLIPFDATTKAANLKIMLGAADFTNTPALAAGDAGVSSFQFYAELNTYAGWKAGDIKVTGAYTLQGIKATDYTKPADDTSGAIYAGLNILKGEGAADPDPTNDVKFGVGATTASLNVVRAGFDNYKVFLADKPATITSVTNTTASFQFTAGTHYDYDSSTGVLTVKLVPSSGNTATITIVAGGKSYALTLNIT